MPISRPVLLALIAAILAAATFMATQSARQEAAEPASVTPAKPRATKAPATPKDPLALPAAQPVKSARFSARIVVTGKPEDAGRAEASGSFESRGVTAPPKFSLNVKSRDQKGALEAGAVSLGDRGFFTVDRVGYPIPPAAWSQVAGMRSQVARYAKPGAKGQALLGLRPTTWLAHEKRSRGPRIDGTDTVHLSGRLDVKRMVTDFKSISGKGGAFKKADLADFVRYSRTSKLDVYTGRSDGVVRRYELRMSGKEKGVRESLRLSGNVAGVNRPQRIAAPARISQARSSVGTRDRKLSSTLFGLGLLGVDMRGLAEARAAGFRFDSSGAPPAKPLPKAAIKAAGLPSGVARAMQQKRIVVLFFRQRGGVDDPETAKAVAALRGTKGVSVFSDSIARLARYGGLVAGLGVSQAPAVVIVGRDGKAQLVEGYVDEQTLAQRVVNAR